MNDTLVDGGALIKQNRVLLVPPLIVEEMEDALPNDKCESPKAERTAPIMTMDSVQYSLSVVLGWLYWLVIALLLLDTVVVSLRSIQLAEDRRIASENNCNSTQDLCYIKRGELLGHSLSSRLFETHPQCLARAISVAHDHFEGLSCQSIGEVVNGTVSWAQDECDKLMFTPTAPPQTGWYRVWRAMAENAKTVLHHCKDAVHHLFKKKEKCTALEMASVDPFVLPPNYRVECTGDHFLVCKLFSTMLSVGIGGDSRDLCEGVAEPQMSGYVTVLTHIHTQIQGTPKLLPWLNCGALVLFLVAFWNIVRKKDVAKGQELLRSFVGYILSQMYFSQLYFWYQKIAEMDALSVGITTETLWNHAVIILVTLDLFLIKFSFRFRVLPNTLSIWHGLHAIYSGSAHKLTEKNSTNMLELVQDSMSDDEAGETDTEAEDDDLDAGINDDELDEVDENTSGITTSLIDRITPDSSFRDDVEFMREQLHREEAASSLADFWGRGLSQDSDSDSEWSVFSEDGSHVGGSLEADE